MKVYALQYFEYHDLHLVVFELIIMIFTFTICFVTNGPSTFNPSVGSNYSWLCISAEQKTPFRPSVHTLT